jgi:hypothetical protein
MAMPAPTRIETTTAVGTIIDSENGKRVAEPYD